MNTWYRSLSEILEKIDKINIYEEDRIELYKQSISNENINKNILSLNWLVSRFLFINKNIIFTVPGCVALFFLVLFVYLPYLQVFIFYRWYS